jgi:hypothetical protein
MDAATTGVMYLALDTTREEIYSILVVRPRKCARPVAVKMLLRKSGGPIPTLEEVGVDRIRQLSTPKGSTDGEPL